VKRFFRTTRGEERHLLDSSFEPHGDGYAFYRHHLARGIPVTAAEREAYLRPPLGGSRRAFYEAIRGREASLPRRGWWRSQHATLAAIPASIGWGLILAGATLLWPRSGLEPPIRWLFTVAGTLSAGYGALVLAVHLLDLRRRRS
jgi:hypothetical protein